MVIERVKARPDSKVDAKEFSSSLSKVTISVLNCTSLTLRLVPKVVTSGLPVVPDLQQSAGLASSNSKVIGPKYFSGRYFWVPKMPAIILAGIMTVLA